MQRTSSTTPILPVLDLVLGIVLVLVGQTFVEPLAVDSDTWYWIQHVMLVVGGICVGSALVVLIRAGWR